MIIGGAEDKLRKRRILREFVAASGGREARIAVIPTASSLGDEIVDVYDALFRAEGAAEVIMVRPESRAEAADPERYEQLEKATGIFMTGGNQLKLSAIICGTPVGEPRWAMRSSQPMSGARSWAVRRPARRSSPATCSPSGSVAARPSSG